MVRKVMERVPDELLQQDLGKYRRMAIELGATDAKVITTDMIVIDERVRAKCIIPLCSSYGTSANCPPYAADLDLMRKIVKNFRYAIFVKLEAPSEQIAGPEAKAKSLPTPSGRKRLEIIAKIEAEAFFDGYHLALGLAGGSCKRTFCPDIECSTLVAGQPCRHPMRARSSMEAVGMDAFIMATKVGWDIYPIGESTPPSEVPYGLRLGLVLIY